MIEPSSQPSSGLPPAAPPPPNLPSSAPRSERGALGLIARVREAQRRELWLQGGISAAGVLLLTLLAGGLVGAASVWAARIILSVGALGALAALLSFGLYRARRVVGDDARTARLIDQRTHAGALELLAAVELRRELERSPPFSAELARAYLAREDERAEAQDPARIVDRKRTTRFWQGLAALAVVVLGVGVFARSTWIAGVRASVSAVPEAKIEQAREPITGDIELTYRYPAYTGLQPRTIAGTSGEITAPAGTEVLLKTRSDREVARAELAAAGKTVPLQVSGGRDLQGSFIIEKAGSYAFVFFNARGKEIARGPETPIHVEVDQAPKISIRTPGEQTEIDPGEKVTLAWEGSDDYGIASLELVYRMPGRTEESRVALPRDEGRRVKGQFSWHLDPKSVSPGDRIQYRIEAKDNDAVAGAKVGASRTQVLTIYSPAAHRRAAMEKAERLWERMVELLADRLEGPDRDEPRDAKKIEAHARVDQNGFALVTELRAGAEEISSQRDAPEELWTALLNIAERLRRRLITTSDARRTYLRYVSLQVPDVTAARRLATVSTKEVAALEKDVLYLESLIDRQKLEELRELAKQLADERRELSSLIDEYKKTQDPNLREDVLRQIDEVRQRMNELMQRMAELRSGIRDEHLNAEALQEMMEEQNVADALDEIEQLMREGKTEEALKKLQELDMQLDEMMSGLDEGAEDFGSEDYAELQKAFSEFMEDLQKTQAEQQRVANETKQLRDKYRDQQRNRMRERAEQLKAQLLKETQSLQREYDGVRPEELPPEASQSLEDAREQLKNLESALEVEDFDLASEAASQAARSADNLAAQAERQRRMDEVFERPADLREQSRELAGALNKDSDRVQEINRKLQEMFPAPSEMLSEADKQRMRQLNNEQRQLQRKAEQLAEQMGEMQQMAPIFGQEASEQMQSVGERMGEAADRLEGRDPRRGYSEQKNALDALQRFQQQMKEQQQQAGKGKGKGIPLPMFPGSRRPGGTRNQEKVEIPNEDQYQAPKEFRQDLLDAMKEGTPEKYREQVKRYYEELVK